MSARIAGSNRHPREVLTVDYADVLRQAVENERHDVLREVLRRVKGVPATERGSRSYNDDDRGGRTVKQDIVAAIEAMSDRG